MFPRRHLSHARLTDDGGAARIVVLPLENDRWVAAFAVGPGEWGEVPGQHASAGAAASAAVREIETRLVVATASAPSRCRPQPAPAQR